MLTNVKSCFFVLTIALLMVLLGDGASAQALGYNVSLSDLDNEELIQALEASSNLLALQDEDPPSAVALVRRVEADVDRLGTALRSFGFYRGTVTATVAGRPLDDPDLLETLATAEQSGTPVDIALTIDPGLQYVIGQLDIVDAEGGSDTLSVEIDRDALGLAVGDPARSEAVLTVERRLGDQMRAQGHPFADVPVRQAVVDHDTQTMELTFAVEPGARAAIGAVQVDGLDQIDADFIERRVASVTGQEYSPDLVEDLRSDLSAIGVFSSVRVDQGEELAPDGTLPVTVTLVERERRFIGAGADYATSEGFGARAYWGHRNLFGSAERLRIEASVGRLLENDFGELEYGLGATLRKPDVLEQRQDLLAGLNFIRTDTDAFERTGVVGTVGLERQLTDTIAVGVGLSAEYDRITDSDEQTDTFRLIGIPLSFRMDTSDDALNPTRGIRLSANVTPYSKFIGSSDDLLVSRVEASSYYDFGSDGRYILAGRAAIGSVLSEGSTEDVPANKRFFAGGGGSIRGYEFQSVGPLDENGDPLGGRSVLELGAELRIRVGESFGIVPFIDGGTVFDDSIPAFDEPLRFAAGIGGRYYTDFGPIRVDFAFPLNGRDRDDAFAFYISLGQAF